MATRIDILLDAQNRASGELRRFQTDAQRIAATISGQLDPALGSLTQSMTNLVGAAGRLGGAMGGVAAVLVVATAGLARWAQAAGEANLRTTELGRLTRSLDFQGVVGGIRSMTLEMDQFDNSLKGMLLSLTRTEGALNVLDRIFGREGLAKSIEDFRRAARATAGPEFGQQTARASAASQATLQDALRGAIGRETSDEGFANVDRINALGSKLTSSIHAEAEAQRQQLRLKAQQERASLIELGLGELTSFVEERLALELRTVQTAEQEKFNQLVAFLQEHRRKALDIILEQDFARQAGEQAAFADAVGAGGPLSADQARAMRDEAIDRAAAQLQIERDRKATLADIASLSRAQAVQLELERIEAERLLQVELAKKDIVNQAAKEQQANLDAQIKAFNLLQAELERINTAAGIGKAAREIEDDWAAAGRRAEETFKGVAGNLQQTLASVLRGDQIGKDFGRTFIDGLRATFANELSKLIIGQLVGSLRGLFGGTVSGPLLGSAPADVTGASPAQLSSLMAQGYQIVGGTGGRSYAVAPGAIGAPTGAYTGATSGDFASSPDVGIVAGAAGGAKAAGSAFSYGGAALSVVGAGLTSFGVYESARASADPGLGGFQGAITGAAFGGQVGGIYGAVIGAVIGFGIGIFGGIAGEDELDIKRRAAKRRETGAAVANFILSTIKNQRLSVREMLATPLPGGFTLASGSGTQQVTTHNTVGGLLLAMAGAGNSGDRAGYVFNADLIAFLRAYGVQREGFNAGDVNSPKELNGAIGEQANAFLSDALTLLKAAAAVDRVPFGFVERGYDAGGSPYLTRTSYLSLGQLGTVPQGVQDLFFSRQVYKELGLTDAQIDGVQRQLNNWTVKRDMLTDLSKERFLAAFP